MIARELPSLGSADSTKTRTSISLGVAKAANAVTPRQRSKGSRLVSKSRAKDAVFSRLLHHERTTHKAQKAPMQSSLLSVAAEATAALQVPAPKGLPVSQPALLVADSPGSKGQAPSCVEPVSSQATRQAIGNSQQRMVSHPDKLSAAPVTKTDEPIPYVSKASQALAKVLQRGAVATAPISQANVSVTGVRPDKAAANLSVSMRMPSVTGQPQALFAVKLESSTVTAAALSSTGTRAGQQLDRRQINKMNLVSQSPQVPQTSQPILTRSVKSTLKNAASFAIRRGVGKLSMPVGLQSYVTDGIKNQPQKVISKNQFLAHVKGIKHHQEILAKASSEFGSSTTPAAFTGVGNPSTTSTIFFEQALSNGTISTNTPVSLTNAMFWLQGDGRQLFDLAMAKARETGLTVKSTVQLTLVPAHLGKLKLHIHADPSGQLQVQFLASVDASKAILEKFLPDLKQQLLQSGFSGVSVDVRSDSQSNRQTSRDRLPKVQAVSPVVNNSSSSISAVALYENHQSHSQGFFAEA